MDFAVIVLQCNGIIIIFGAVRVRSNNTKWQKDKLLATTITKKTSKRTTRRRRATTTTKEEEEDKADWLVIQYNPSPTDQSGGRSQP